MTNAIADPLAGRIAAHLHRLAADIGPRPAGSAGNRAAAEYIRSVFESCGLPVELQEIPCPAWEEGQTLLEVDGQRLDAVANAFSPACNVSAPAVAVGTIAQLQAAVLKGRIGILFGDLAAEPLSPKSWFLKTEREDQIIRLLEEKEPAALITVQPRLGELQRIIVDWEFRIPSATVPARSGLALLRAANPLIHLTIDSRQQPGRTWNICARQPGAGAERIVLCAHYDTQFGTPGALDNAGGVALVLALAEQLSRVDHRLGLEYIAFANEDSCLPTGSMTYVDSPAADLANIVAVANVDGAGHALDVNTVCMMAHGQPFQALVDDVKQSYPGIIWIDPWPQSDHSAFAMQGVPALALTSRAGFYLAHLRDDTVDWANPAGLADLCRLVIAVIGRLQDKSAAWTRPSQA